MLPTTNRDRFKNADTGEPPTDAEWKEMVEAARRYLDNWKYSAPESIDWAMLVDPAYAEMIHG